MMMMSKLCVGAVALLAFAMLFSVAFASVPQTASAANLQRCKIPQDQRSFTHRFKANTSCREARRVLRNRRFDDGRYESRGRRGLYRCRVRPNRFEGANWRCVNRKGRTDIVRFQTRAGR